MASSNHSSQKSKQNSLNHFLDINFLFSLLLIILGAIILVRASISRAGLSVKSEQLSNNFGAKPAKLYIPRLSRVLYVSDGYVAGDRWTVSQTGVSYLTTSASPGQIGNAVIYGHNTKNILGGLARVQEDDQVYVVLENGQFVEYQVSEKKEIKPTQVEILNQSKDSRLTIYTCSGFLDTARFVVTAQQVEKAI